MVALNFTLCRLELAAAGDDGLVCAGVSGVAGAGASAGLVDTGSAGCTGAGAVAIAVAGAESTCAWESGGSWRFWLLTLKWMPGIPGSH